MIRFRTAETRPITRELAGHFQAMRQVDAERKMKPQRLAQLGKLMASGDIKCFDWAVAHLANEEIRVNGNHSSYLLAKPDAVIPPGATAVIQRYDCDTMADVVQLWGMFDSTISIRNKGENLAIFARSVPGLEGVNQEAITLVQSALVLDHSASSQTVLTTAERNQLVASNVPYARWFAAVYRTGGTKDKLFKRAGVAYAALLTFRKDEAKATEFWQEVATGSNADPCSGSRHLREYLLVRPKRPGVRSEKSGTAWEDMAKNCVHCWNLWRKGETVKYLRAGKNMAKAI